MMELIVLGLPIPPTWDSNSSTPHFVCVSAPNQFIKKVEDKKLDFFGACQQNLPLRPAFCIRKRRILLFVLSFL